MKKLLLRSNYLMAATLAAILSIGCSSVPDETSGKEEETRLQVHIQVPPDWGSWLEDDMGEAMFNRIRYIFRREGFPGEIAEVDRLEDPTEDLPILAMRLHQWEVDHGGYVRCAARVEYRPVTGEPIDLGNFQGTEFTWGPSGELPRAHQFLDAADAVALKVWKKLKSDIPGFPGTVENPSDP